MACPETGFDGPVSIIFGTGHDGAGTAGSCEDPLSGQQDEQRGDPPPPAAANPAGAPPASTAGPATAVPSAAPTPKVVTSQENASVTVPRGACRSTTMKAQAMAGARKTPATVISTDIAVTPGTSISGR